MGRILVIVIIQPEQTAVLAADQASFSISCFYLDVDVGRSLRSICVKLPGGFGLSMIATSSGGCGEGEARAGMSIQDTGQID